MINDPEDIDPDVLAAAVRSQLDNYDSDTADRSPQGYAPAQMSDAQVIRAMGKDPAELMNPNFPREATAYRAAVGKDQALQAKAAADQAKLMEKQMDPAYIAQQVYASTGNIGAARTIAKTRGPSIFTHGQIIEMGRGGSYGIKPAGDIDEMGVDGKRKRTSMSDYIHRNGVSAVPFLSGDEAAVVWRRNAAKTSEVMVILDQIEDLYNKPGWKSLPGSPLFNDTRSQLEQLEKGLVTVVTSLKSGSVSMAGVSDVEMDQIQATLPRASIDLLKPVGDGLVKLNKTREQLRGILIRTAYMNGLVLEKLKDKPEATAGSPTGQQSTNNIPDGLAPR